VVEIRPSRGRARASTTLDRPRLALPGASYGGGIQLVAAAIDPRVDAIVPTIAWHSSDLYGRPRESPRPPRGDHRRPDGSGVAVRPAGRALFTLAEADANAKLLIKNGVPTKVVWFCGRHGECVSSTNDGEMVKGRPSIGSTDS
jgi:ABC-2 type transport system ATP-binding protein